MTHNFLSVLWDSLAPAVANHLWQSTLVALAAGLLTLAFRKHRAGARYWLWLAASLKFLIPFSMLIAIGRSVAWPHATASTAPVRLYSAVEDITQPFAQSAYQVVPQVIPGTSSWALVAPVPVVLWFLGFLAVLFL